MHHASTVPAAPVLLHFTHCCFCYNFWFLLILTLVIALVSVFFVISLALSTYISLSLYKLTINSLPSRRQYRDRGDSFVAASSFLPLSFIFFSIFSATKHSFEDDNSKDGWVDLFLLEEDGCWLGFEVK